MFKVTKVNSLSLSEKISQKRSCLKLDLGELALKTGISKKYLRRIEQGKWHKMPSQVYVKGFLSKYARVLSLNPKKVLAQYEKECRIRQKIEMPRLVSDMSSFWKSVMSFMVTPKNFRNVSLFVFIAFVIAYFSIQLVALVRQPTIKISTFFSDISDSSNITIRGKTHTDNRLTINSRKVYLDEDGEFKEEFTLDKGVNSFDIITESPFGKKKEIVKKIYYK